MYVLITNKITVFKHKVKLKIGFDFVSDKSIIFYIKFTTGLPK